MVALVRARVEAHAIELANDTEYGLSSAVFTRDPARGLRVARQIKSDICHINGPTVHDEPQTPFAWKGAERRIEAATPVRRGRGRGRHRDGPSRREPDRLNVRLVGAGGASDLVFRRESPGVART